MPGRLRPSPAMTVGVLSFVTLAAVLGMFYARGEPDVQSAATFPSWATSSCAVVRADRWSPLPGVDYTGRLQMDLPAAADASMVLFVSDPLQLDLEASSVDGRPVPFQRERLRVGPGATIPPDLWIERGSPWDLPTEAVKATFAASPVGMRRLTLWLGRRAPSVLARLVGYPDSARASVCAARLGVSEAFSSSDTIEIGPRQADWFGAGWTGVEGDGAASVRWMGGHGAILVPSARDGSVTVRLRAAPGAAADAGDPPLLSLVVNDVFTAEAIAMREGFSTYTWEIPDRAWLPHTNELLFRVSRTEWTPSPRSYRPRAHGLALRRLELELGK